ncbi:hypothetical protein N658DRAFT_198117 [Parathielavia hyrcaniae]|uniref:Uncharacterized protein n=1 Tax=Parathielavia hyrcaniae TaxID=113614 RepID=A0AAN6Q7I1_9PEZI|nr:hypothetical protein N658DRAFT_198117 [Parathielavia hyrcaniae]
MSVAHLHLHTVYHGFILAFQTPRLLLLFLNLHSYLRTAPSSLDLPLNPLAKKKTTTPPWPPNNPPKASCWATRPGTPSRRSPSQTGSRSRPSSAPCSTPSSPSSPRSGPACAARAARRCASTRRRPRSRASPARCGGWRACSRAAAATAARSGGSTGSGPGRTRRATSTGGIRATTTSAWSRCVRWGSRWRWRRRSGRG